MFPTVTVVIATLNRPTLKKSLESLRNQDVPLKVIYVTNFISVNHIRDLHFSVISHIEYEIITSDSSLYGCLNEALKAVTTDYISFLHDDDWYGESFFSHAVHLMEEDPEVNWCFGNVFEIQVNGTSVFLGADPYYFIGIEQEPPRIWHPSGIYRKNLFNNDKVGDYRTFVNGTKLLIAADYDWFLRAEMLGIRGTKLSEMQYFMRFGGLSTTNHELSILECVLIVSELYPDSGLTQLWMSKYSNYFIKNQSLVKFSEKAKILAPSFLRRRLKNIFLKILRRRI